MMRMQGWPAVLAVLMVMGSPGAVRAELVSFAFMAEDGFGRVASGVFTHELIASGFLGANAIGENYVPGQPVYLAFSLEGTSVTLRMPGMVPNGIFAATRANDAFYGASGASGVADWYIINGSGSSPASVFRLDLIDTDATAFSTRAGLPISLDLADFETRTLLYGTSRTDGGYSFFRGTITSLNRLGAAVVPEPGSLVMCGPIALAGALLRWRRWRWMRALA